MFSFILMFFCISCEACQSASWDTEDDLFFFFLLSQWVKGYKGGGGLVIDSKRGVIYNYP